MKDEEMADKHAEEYRKTFRYYRAWHGQVVDKSPSTIVEQSFKDGFLAGLKAGRPQWHFVSKEGFPSKDDIYLIIRNDGLHLGDYCCGGDGDIDCQSWCDYPSEEEIQDDSVIAWCEIPTFDKE